MKAHDLQVSVLNEQPPGNFSEQKPRTLCLLAWEADKRWTWRCGKFGAIDSEEL
jgi:hypothetical protein